MSAQGQAIAEVSRYCDLADRLPLVPPSAEVRGMYFRSIENALATRGALGRYREIFPERFASLRWYPVTEFLPRLAVGGGLVFGPERVHEGMFEIGRGNAAAFMTSALGRVLIRLLASDPKRVLQQAIAGRRQSQQPVRWHLTFPDSRSAVMHIVEEYAYFESYQLGAAHGTFEAIDLPVRIRCIVRDRFSGEHMFDW